MKHLKNLPFLIYFLFGIVGTVLSSNESAPQPSSPSIQMRVEASPRKGLIGDPIQLNIHVTFNSSINPQPFIPNASWGNFELTDYNSENIVPTADGKLSQSHYIRLVTFSTGTQTIPSQTLTFTTSKEESVEAKTDPIPIEIESLLEKWGDKGGLMPTKGFIGIRDYTWLWITLSFLLIGLVIAYLLFWRKKKTLNNQNIPTMKPEERAWASIHELEEANLIEKGEIKEFYIRLSFLLRVYLEDRWQLAALEKTTSELMAEFRNHSFNSDHISLLRQFFEKCDLVKFAKFVPIETEIETDFIMVKQFISETTPEPEPKSKPKEAIPV